MPRPIAVLVEDNAEQSEFSRSILESVGYTVHTFFAASPALDAIGGVRFFADLFVLDRRLPVNEGEPDTDEVGDDLLAEVKSRFPDARIIVFTGFATINQLQVAMSNNGQIPTGDGGTIDRVSVFKKDQSIEFREAVAKHADVLRRLNDIEVASDIPSVQIDSGAGRLIKRVALAYNATSVTARRLSGGLSSSSVWSCELRDAHSVVARVVVKDVKKPDQLAGLASLLPASMALSTLATLSGLINGRYVNVMRAAGAGSISLFELLGQDPSQASAIIAPIARALSEVPVSSTTKRLDEVIANFISYDEMAVVLDGIGVPAPSPSMQISVQQGWRHGDLHPGNVLIIDEGAALIDFDSECVAGGCVDLIALELSTLVHPESPIRGQLWPGEEEIRASLGTANFGASHGCAVWFAGLNVLFELVGASHREVWATRLAYAARQLRYDDVRADVQVTSRVIAIIARACSELDLT